MFTSISFPNQDSWLGCGYCWPREWFQPAGFGLLANRRIVFGNLAPLAMNVGNYVKQTGSMLPSFCSVIDH